MVPEDAGFVTIIEWPGAMRADSRAETLVRLLGMDPHAAEAALARGVPQLVAREASGLARQLVAAFERVGVLACAPSLAELAGLGPARRVRRLCPAEGAPEPMYLAEPWQGEGFGLRCSQIRLLVRARLPKLEKRVRERDSGSGVPSGMAFYAPGAAIVAAAASAMDTPVAGGMRTAGFREVIDLYLNDGERWRFDGDKMSFAEALGGERFITDVENMDRLALKLADQSLGAAVETGFRRFRPTPGTIHRSDLRIGGAEIRSQSLDPVFEFYSVWAWFVHRRRSGG